MTLDELQKICDEATPGPWERLNQVQSTELGRLRAFATGPVHKEISSKYIDSIGNKAFSDAEFITAARTYMPLLIEVTRAAINARFSTDDRDGLLELDQVLIKLRKTLVPDKSINI